MHSLIDLVLFPLKRVLLAHFNIIVHAITPRSRVDEAEGRCERMRERLFGPARH